MPLPISLAHKLAHRLAEVRRAELMPYLGPDGKTQVTVRYENGRPIEIERVLISTQHKDGVDPETLIKPDLWEHVVHPILPGELYDEKKLLDKAARNFLVNPTGKFVIGGPVGDAGLTGRKIIVDTYGGMARHGGGAFSGKDPSKVDRSAAYAARYVAKNVVAAGLAEQVRGPGRLRDRRGAPRLGDGRDVRHRRRSPAARSRGWSTSTSTFAPAPSATTSTCTARSTRRPRPTATSAARTTTSPGRRPTRRTTLRRPRVSASARRHPPAPRARLRRRRDALALEQQLSQPARALRGLQVALCGGDDRALHEDVPLACERLRIPGARLLGELTAGQSRSTGGRGFHLLAARP